jgi:hypothetical protein
VPQLVESPVRVPVPGGKQIEEYVGAAPPGPAPPAGGPQSTPAGGEEPAQTPAFDEVTLVLGGAVHVEHDGGVLVVGAGQAVLTRAGERVRYTTPDGAEYVAVCLPAFTPDTVNREE